MVLPALGGDTIKPRWPLPIGRDQVDDPRRDVLGAAVAALQRQPFIGVQRCQVLEQHLILGGFRRLEIDVADLEQGEVALAFLGRANLAADRVAGAQVEAADLTGRNVDVVRAGQIGAVGGAQEAEAILQNFQHAVAGDILAALGQRLEDGEDDILFAGPRHAFEFQFLRDGDQVGGGFLF